MGRMCRARAVMINAGAVVLVALSVCSPGSPTPTANVSGTQQYRIAAASVRADAINLARLDGVLEGSVNADGTACFWVGHGSVRTALFWPYGYKAAAPPLAVYDDEDLLVAAVGESVTMAGGLLPDGVHAILGCPGFTNFWGVGRVDKAT